MLLGKSFLARLKDVKKLSVVTLSSIFLCDLLKEEVTNSASPTSLPSLPTQKKDNSAK